MNRKAIIYKPAKNAMQSGLANTSHWVLEFASDDRKAVDPVMGWISSADTTRQLRMYFATQDEAESYARENDISWELRQPHSRAVKPKSYAANFAYNRREYTDIVPKNNSANA